LLIDAETPGGPLPGLRIGLLGSHQVGNAVVALALLDALVEDAARRGRPFELTSSAVRNGFARARWPGRLELFETTPHGRILLDGAHNPAGARALATALAELGVHGFPLVFGAMRGKHVSGVLRALAPLRPRPVFTTASTVGAHRPATLLHRWQRVAGPGSAAETPGRALELAAELRSEPGQPIVVAGSLYLVGAVRGMLTGEVEPE
jgi:dihydrofolate synthase/folylpolyglutamate synthase